MCLAVLLRVSIDIRIKKAAFSTLQEVQFVINRTNVVGDRFI